uniref:Uncharacterized protein n=1 Tax=Arundo donax TaxID=35708 RepID=A0A0A8ZDM0_ARUDO
MCKVQKWSVYIARSSTILLEVRAIF